MPYTFKHFEIEVRKLDYRKPASDSYVFVSAGVETLDISTREEFDDLARQLNLAADEAFGPTGMKLLVCGGRDFAGQTELWAALDALSPKEVCQGGARGADELAGLWAAERGVPCSVFKADWETHGKAAGPIRNAEMLKAFKPTLVLATPGGRGTDDMVRRSRKAGVPVLRLEL
jgi:hypothetical protein